MAEIKMCPMSFSTDPAISHVRNCIKEKCAWWNDNPLFESSMCAIKSIAIQFENIAIDKRNKMEKEVRESEREIIKSQIDKGLR